MNVSIIDPLQGDFPEIIEEYLEHGQMKCIAFNRRGTLLAAGCQDGSCVIWDFETRGIAKELRDKDCIVPITSVCWSKYGHHILVAATDKSLTLWDVASGAKVTRMTLQQTTLHARLHPGTRTSSVCLACPLSSAPLLVDLNTGSTTVLPVSVSDSGDGVVPLSRNKSSDGSPPFTPTAARFNKYGDLIYLGNSKGEILIIDFKNIQVHGIIPISGGAVIKNIMFSRNGQYLLTNSNDRTIRVYENHLPQKDALQALDELKRSMDELHGIEKLKAVGSKSLVFCREFQDSINKIQWKAPCFSGDSEWVVGASGSKGEHKIYIWDRAGHLIKILEGPKEALTDLAWHPVKPIMVSVSLSGLVYIWAKDFTENWSAFAPDFKELEENEEYVEREDEFDLVPDTEKVKVSDVNEDEEVDILTVEKDSTFSDSDMSQEELCFLPAIPCPDNPEQQDKFVSSSSKLVDSNHSQSPFSMEATQQNGHASNAASSPVEECSKRKRKPSEKGLELQAEKGRKPVKKTKSSDESSRLQVYRRRSRVPTHLCHEDEPKNLSIFPDKDESSSNTSAIHRLQVYRRSSRPNIIVSSLPTHLSHEESSKKLAIFPDEDESSRLQVYCRRSRVPTHLSHEDEPKNLPIFPDKDESSSNTSAIHLLQVYRRRSRPNIIVSSLPTHLSHEESSKKLAIFPDEGLKLNYNTYDVDLYAVVQSLRYWRHYLIHREFLLHSDHATLRYLD